MTSQQHNDCLNYDDVHRAVEDAEPHDEDHYAVGRIFATLLSGDDRDIGHGGYGIFEWGGHRILSHDPASGGSCNVTMAFDTRARTLALFTGWTDIDRIEPYISDALASLGCDIDVVPVHTDSPARLENATSVNDLAVFVSEELGHVDVTRRVQSQTTIASTLDGET
jgi:hypothetical protein